jgi:hypothetical protein
MEPGSYTLRPTRWLTEGAVPGADMLALVADFDSEGVGVRCGAVRVWVFRWGYLR